MDIKKLEGRKILEVEIDSSIVRITTDGGIFKFYHDYSCCERVDLLDVEDVKKDFENLIGEVIIAASEVDNKEELPKEHDLEKYTFYTITCNKGFVQMRWFGSSNGYYSVSVQCEEIL